MHFREASCCCNLLTSWVSVSKTFISISVDSLALDTEGRSSNYM